MALLANRDSQSQQPQQPADPIKFPSNGGAPPPSGPIQWPNDPNPPNKDFPSPQFPPIFGGGGGGDMKPLPYPTTPSLPGPSPSIPYFPQIPGNGTGTFPNFPLPPWAKDWPVPGDGKVMPGPNPNNLTQQDVINTRNRIDELRKDDSKYPVPIAGPNPNDPRTNEMNILSQRMEDARNAGLDVGDWGMMHTMGGGTLGSILGGGMPTNGQGMNDGPQFPPLIQRLLDSMSGLTPNSRINNGAKSALMQQLMSRLIGH